MTLDYFYGQAGELFSFYRIPKALFQEPRFQNLSTDDENEVRHQRIDIYYSFVGKIDLPEE